MDPNMFGPSGGFQGIKATGQNPISPVGAPRTSMPVGTPQKFGAPPMSGGGMQPPPQFGGGNIGGGMPPQAPQTNPGNSFFGHSQGNPIPGMQQHNTMQPRLQDGMNPNPTAFPPELLAQLMQLFGSSQGGGISQQHRYPTPESMTTLGIRPEIANSIRF